MSQASEENTAQLLDWAIQSGINGLKARTESLAAIKREGATTLAILLGGAAGGLAYAVKGLDQGTPWMLWGAAAFSVYLFVLCTLLVAKVLSIKAFPALHTLPSTIFQPEWGILDLKEKEVESLDRRILQAVDIIDSVANWLDRLRYAAILSPVVLIVAASAAQFFWTEAPGTPAAEQVEAGSSSRVFTVPEGRLSGLAEAQASQVRSVVGPLKSP